MPSLLLPAHHASLNTTCTHLNGNFSVMNQTNSPAHLLPRSAVLIMQTDMTSRALMEATLAEVSETQVNTTFPHSHRANIRRMGGPLQYLCLQ